MPNYGNYYIGIRLLLLKEYLQANAGPYRPIKRRELEAYLTEKGYPIEKKTLYADFAVLGQVFDLHSRSAWCNFSLFWGTDFGFDNGRKTRLSRHLTT